MPMTEPKYLSSLFRGRDNNIILLRLLAAILVVLGHSYHLLYPQPALKSVFLLETIIRKYSSYNMGLAGFGVTTFFFISGLLITRSFIYRKSLLSFTVSRCLRVYPALIVAVLFCVCIVGPLFTTLPFEEYFTNKMTYKYLWSNSFLTTSFFPKLPTVFDSHLFPGVNGNLWTLPVELRMYAIVALLGVCGILFDVRAFNFFCLIVVLLYAADVDLGLMQSLRHKYLCLYFLVGASFALNADRIPISPVWLVILVSITISAYGTPFYNLIFAISFSYFIAFISFYPRLQKVNWEKYGDYSYGIYLYSFPFQQMTISINSEIHPLNVFSLSLMGAGFMSLFSWFVVEKRALSMKGTVTTSILRMGYKLSTKWKIS